jgi:hypothetical protein
VGVEEKLLSQVSIEREREREKRGSQQLFQISHVVYQSLIDCRELNSASNAPSGISRRGAVEEKLLSLLPYREREREKERERKIDFCAIDI